MKKISLIAGLVCLALNAMAAVTPTGKLNITISAAGQEDKVLRLRQHSTFSDAFDNTWDAENPQEGGVYVISETKHYVTWASNKFEDLHMGFGAGENTAYKLVFSNFGGETIKVKDLVADVEVEISASTSLPYEYNFTIDESLKNSAIEDRFVINYVPNPSLCFNYNVLEVKDHNGETLVVKQGDTEIANVASLGSFYTLDLSAYTGRLVVTLNGTDYQIDANPAVTPVP